MEIYQEQVALGVHLAKIAEEGALQVAPYVLQAFKAGIQAEEKKGYFDLVTEADRNTEARLVKYLTQSYPRFIRARRRKWRSGDRDSGLGH